MNNQAEIEIKVQQEELMVIFQEIGGIAERDRNLTSDCLKLTRELDDELRAIKYAYVDNLKEAILRYNDKLLRLYNKL
jgi:ABC-type uncharacterized transport system auxiliary subunit